ncbi:hypothetical protein GCM10027048_28170 [Hymenobacter coalescens]
MKPPKFHVGQAVVALTSDWLEPAENKALGYPQVPQKSAHYTVSEVYRAFYGIWVINLSGIPCLGFDEQYFDPVEEHPAEVIETLLEESFTIKAQ